MNRNIVFATIVILVCCLSLSFSGWMYFSRTKVGYVRSQDLVSRFKGTIEARGKFEAKKNQMIANADSMEVMVSNTKQDYLKFRDGMSAAQRSEQEQSLQQQEQQLMQYRSAIISKMEEEDNAMMTGVLGQVNSFIEQYARKNEYDFILGTTLNGSLLYAREEMDLTEKLIEEINIKYQGK